MNGKLIYAAACIAGLLIARPSKGVAGGYNLLVATKTARQTTGPAVNVNKLGIYGDGQTDVSAKVQQALTQHKSLFFPKGNYVIGHQIALGAGCSITGVAAAVLENRPGFGDESFFLADAKSNITIKNVAFASKEVTRPVYALLINGTCSGISVSRVTAKQCGIVHSRIANQAYRQIADGHQQGASAVSITGCSGTGTRAVMGIYLEYASDWKINSTKLSGYQHGIEWWGGDSNPQKDGELDNPRLAQRGQITNVTVSHATEGGIWGSMGDGIVVSNCKVNNCGDVGIDFEGCFNSRATGNTVSNCHNGALATFHYNKNVIFSNNIVSQNSPAFPLARIYNASQTPKNRDITFTGNSFTATTGVGIINQSGPAQSIRFSQNKLNNVVLDLAFNNNQTIRIDYNTFNITRSASAYNFIIKAGSTNNNGRVIVENNTISNSPVANSNIAGIYITQFDYNTAPVNQLNQNSITGIKKQYKIEWNGQNAGVISKTYINTTQKLSADAIEKVGQSKSASEVYLNNTKQ